MSDSMKIIQARCGATADGQFGPNTAKAIAKHYELSPERAAHLLGQAAHESGGFRHTRENLNYSTSALMRVFGKRYFPTKALAEKYARQPEQIANYVYMDENRSKRGALGNVNPGDGWLFRGRGWLQCTGRTNYRAFAAEMRLPDVMNDPDLIATDYPLESAIWFFTKNNLWNVCDNGVDEETIRKVTRVVNGGTNGIDHRISETKIVYGWLS